MAGETGTTIATTTEPDDGLTKADRKRQGGVVKAAKTVKWATHPDVVRMVYVWAKQMKSQATIAANLGKPLRTLEAAMAIEKGDNPLRLAFEGGRAACEQAHIDACQLLKPNNPKEMVAWIFYMKAQFGWRDKPDVGGGDAPRITFVLPGSLPMADYYLKLGITAPIDTRPLDKRGAPGSAPDMKDVTPGADGKLPVLSTAILTAQKEGETP